MKTLDFRNCILNCILQDSEDLRGRAGARYNLVRAVRLELTTYGLEVHPKPTPHTPAYPLYRIRTQHNAPSPRQCATIPAGVLHPELHPAGGAL